MDEPERTQPARLSRYQHFLFVAGAACAVLVCATLALIVEIQRGLPFPFVSTLAIAAGLGLVAPLAVLALWQRVRGAGGIVGSYVVFLVACAVLGVTLALIAF